MKKIINYIRSFGRGGLQKLDGKNNKKGIEILKKKY